MGGRFVIEYHVKDRAGLANCEPAKRTVIVKDTLQDAKVLTVQQLNDRMNTAYADSLMAEESPATASNGWVIGAAASAVTGLALLGFSQRKTIVTTVPVQIILTLASYGEPCVVLNRGYLGTLFILYLFAS